MLALAGEADPERQIAPLARLAAIFAALVSAGLGYALGEALVRARTSDAFLVAPSLGRLATYGLFLALLAGLTLAFEFAAPPVVARGGRAARNLRALIRRRARHGRTRAEIDNVEVGLTISFVAIALTAAFVFLSLKVWIVVIATLAILLNLSAISSWCRLVDYDVRWSGLMGFLYGLGLGYVFN